MIQIILLCFCWKFAYEDQGFIIMPTCQIDMLIARFIAAMFMHINVEKDVRNGIAMMKYAVNHYENFTTVYPAFLIALMYTTNSFLVEINVMLILSSLGKILDVIMKYVSLAAIANIPRFYYASLSNLKPLKFGGHKLKISNFRKDGKIKEAPRGVKCLRIIYKIWRCFFCSVSYYFMPFMNIVLNFSFMITPTNLCLCPANGLAFPEGHSADECK
jgi:hypothetical protein